MRHLIDLIESSGLDRHFADRAAELALKFGVEVEISDIDESDSVYDYVADLPIDLDKTLVINRFDAIEPRKGNGGRAMEQVCALADQEGITLVLEPWSGRTPTPVLVKFYSRFGFVLNGEWMHRTPN